MSYDWISGERKLPANFGPMKGASGHARITGPCGDTMEFWVRTEENSIVQVTFTTDGCAASIASGSTAAKLAETAADRQKVFLLSQDDILAALGGLPEEERHCALLAVSTLKAALSDSFGTWEGQPEECHTDECQPAGRQAMENQSGEPQCHDTPGRQICGTCESEGCSARQAREGESQNDFKERQSLESRMCRIAHKVIVLSGKGGVGKSTVAVNLAISLALAGRRVGLLDIDIHGPSVPKMLQLEGRPLQITSEQSILPIRLGDKMKVMSIGFLLRNQDDAIIWRGPLKMGVIRQFLKDVEWGDLDFLVIDSPPGTGDELLSICQLIEDIDGAVVVTTPQEVATADVRKSISFCRQLSIPLFGVIENMSGFACPTCGQVTQIFKTGGGEQISRMMNIPFLGRIPIDPKIGDACDAGTPYVHHYAQTETARAFEHIIGPILHIAIPEHKPEEAIDPQGVNNPQGADSPQRKENTMRVAIPVANGKLSMHFGHCEKFALIDVDPKTRAILKNETIDAPEHQPGLLPPWLAERGVQVVIAGGMGERAQSLFAQNNITVVVGAAAEAPEKLIVGYLDGTLQVGENVCDH
ncbi:MAG: iron-sulfur cluster carrier protein MrpORP [bacterium]